MVGCWSVTIWLSTISKRLGKLNFNLNVSSTDLSVLFVHVLIKVDYL